MLNEEELFSTLLPENIFPPPQYSPALTVTLEYGA
jgi:hypothetical protein